MEENHFVVIDVETANPDYASICAIGFVEFKGEEIVDSWTSLIDPQDTFSDNNIHIHRISPEMVVGKPTFPAVHTAINIWLQKGIVCSFTHFDRTALQRAAEKYDLSLPYYQHVDVCRAARIAWPESENHKLATIAKLCNINFYHHDALEDARAAGQVIIGAMKKTGKNINEWPISNPPKKKTFRSTNRPTVAVPIAEQKPHDHPVVIALFFISMLVVFILCLFTLNRCFP